MNLFGDFTLRIFVAWVMGILIGLEREYRAKEAGYRTHFLVALGSALMMIVSQYGFEDVLKADLVRLDPSRIAAQVVSGIGFIGAGTIILQKQIVRGLTTAAGVWATAGIGLAVGAGMYGIGIVATALVLIGLEALGLFFGSLGLHGMVVEFFVTDKALITKISSLLQSKECVITSYEMKDFHDASRHEYLVSMTVKAKRMNEHALLQALQDEFPEVSVTKIV